MYEENPLTAFPTLQQDKLEKTTGKECFGEAWEILAFQTGGGELWELGKLIAQTNHVGSRSSRHRAEKVARRPHRRDSDN